MSLRLKNIFYVFVLLFGCMWLLSSLFGPISSDDLGVLLSLRLKLNLHQKLIREYEHTLRKHNILMEEGTMLNFTNQISKFESKRQTRLQSRSTSDKTKHETIPWIPWIYAITPTYARPEQKAELTRLRNTLLHLPNFHWILVEDSAAKTDLVTKFLHRSGLSYTHLSVATPEKLVLKPGEDRWVKNRGVIQRNAGLRWIRGGGSGVIKPSVVYFMDDDNTYDLELFAEMRKTIGVSIWPVGLACKLRYERPLCTNGKVTGYYTYWMPKRAFATDMAGFAVNTRVLLRFYQAEFSTESDIGHLETDFLQQITTMEQLEPLFNCTGVYVWHTRTAKPDLTDEDKMIKDFGHGSDLNIEV